MPTLNWIGKEKVVNHHLNVPFRTLEKKYTFAAEGQGDGGNMVIHGDNLDALKALLPMYEGKVKCIYIDPPYNTAKSSEKNKAWVYSDNVDEPHIMNWLNDAVGDEGEDFSRHDKWLCMMYPRLKLLQKLLSEDGVIFISIDDNENALLRIICDEIFGRKNFIAQLIWRSDGNFDNQAKIKICHEYILCYSKEPNILGLPNGIDPSVTGKSKVFNETVRNTIVKNGYKNPMSIVTLPKGFPCAEVELTINERYDEYPYYHQTAIIKNGILQSPVEVESGWSSKNILLEFIKNGFKPVPDTKGQMTTFEITKTGAIEGVKKREKVSHVLSVLSSLGSTQSMSTELSSMNIIFDFPKPIELIEYLIGFYCEENDVVLDSFAGSGTTAHAVLNMNKRDGGHRKFILVEMMDYADNITAERVKRVIQGYGEGKKAVEGTGGGFSYYELGEALLVDGLLNPDVSVDKIRAYVYYTETRAAIPPQKEEEPYLLGVHNDHAYYFYYEKDRVTTLNHAFLGSMKTAAQGYLIYADVNALSAEEMEKYHITFKKIPRDIAHL